MKILFPCAEFPTAFCLIKAVLTVRRHPGNRFFTLCYYSASLPSHMAFLRPFRMTGDGKVL